MPIYTLWIILNHYAELYECNLITWCLLHGLIVTFWILVKVILMINSASVCHRRRNVKVCSLHLNENYSFNGLVGFKLLSNMYIERVKGFTSLYELYLYFQTQALKLNIFTTRGKSFSSPPMSTLLVSRLHENCNNENKYYVFKLYDLLT